MSARAMAWAWEQVPGSRPAKLVLIALADRADEEGVCWPSRKWLARKCRPMGVDAVTRALKQLSDQGLVLKEERQRRDDGTLSTWIVRLPIGEQPVGENAHWTPVGENANAEPKNKDLPPNGGRARDLVFDALTERFGAAPQARHLRGGWNSACAALKADGWDGCTPSLAELEAAYRELYGDAALTPMALAKHYTMLVHKVGGRQRARAAACDECGTGAGLHSADCSHYRAVA